MHLGQHDRRQVPHLRPAHPASAASARSAPHPEQSPGAGSVSVRSGVTVGASPDPLRPGCPPGLRSADRSRDDRSARRLALAAIESAEGGLEELVESRPSRASSCAIRAWVRSSSEAKPTTSADSSSYEGDGGSGVDTTQMIDDQVPRSNSTRRHRSRQPANINSLRRPSSTGPVNGHPLRRL